LQQSGIWFKALTGTLPPNLQVFGDTRALLLSQHSGTFIANPAMDTTTTGVNPPDKKYSIVSCQHCSWEHGSMHKEAELGEVHKRLLKPKSWRSARLRTRQATVMNFQQRGQMFAPLD
jgi:hypothetical protein